MFWHRGGGEWTQHSTLVALVVCVAWQPWLPYPWLGSWWRSTRCHTVKASSTPVLMWHETPDTRSNTGNWANGGSKRLLGYVSRGTPTSDAHSYLRMKSLRMQFATLFSLVTHEPQLLIELLPSCRSHFCFSKNCGLCFFPRLNMSLMVWSPDLSSSLGNLSWPLWDHRK